MSILKSVRLLICPIYLIEHLVHSKFPDGIKKKYISIMGLYLLIEYFNPSALPPIE